MCEEHSEREIAIVRVNQVNISYSETSTFPPSDRKKRSRSPLLWLRNRKEDT